MPTEISTIHGDHAAQGLRRVLSAREQLVVIAEIMRTISGSRNDVQAVFDGIVNSAVRLLRANASTLSRIIGNQITLAATTSTEVAGDRNQGQCFPLPLNSHEEHAWVARTKIALNVADAFMDLQLPDAQRACARIRGDRSLAVVPLLLDDGVVGALEFPAAKRAASPMMKSPFFRRSRIRPSLPSRMLDLSMNCASRCNNKPPQQKF